MSYKSLFFKRSEFACHCGCGFGLADGEVSDKLLKVLDQLRTHFMQPITVTSGCRCVDHNDSVGGKANSQHLYGKAADIKVKGVVPSEVHAVVLKMFPKSLGIGSYSSFTHIDVRDYKARW